MQGKTSPRQGKAKQGKTSASQQLLTQVIVCAIVYLLIAKQIHIVCKIWKISQLPQVSWEMTIKPIDFLVYS